MIMRMAKCPNCKIGIVSIQENSDFFTTLCSHCKEKCIYITKEREAWVKEMLLSTNFQLWKIALLENNVKLKYIHEGIFVYDK